MKTANIHEAKSQLSKLIEDALNGEEVVICKSGKPIIELKPYKKRNTKRRAGLYKKSVKMKDNFDELPDDFLNNFKLGK